MWIVKKASSKAKKITKGLSQTVSSVQQSVSSKVSSVSSKVSSVSQGVSDKVSSVSVFKTQTQSVKMIKNIISNTDTVMPMKIMSELAMKSYGIEQFESIVDFISEKLHDIKMEKKSLKKRLNLLILVNYLIKYGASGFIDEFRAILDIFTKYQELPKSNEDQNMKVVLLDVSQRAINIKNLLNDKDALNLEKQVARMVKEKLLLQKGDYSQHSKEYESSTVEGEGEKKGENEEVNGSKMQKVESFLEMYIWKYTSKLDKKLDDITDKIIERIDDYLDGQIPENFQIEELDNQSPMKLADKENKNLKRQQSVFMRKKLKVEEQNLLDFKEEPMIIPQMPEEDKADQKETDALPTIVIDFSQRVDEKEEEGGQKECQKEEIML